MLLEELRHMANRMTPEEIIEKLGLVPLENEGGLVLETYRSPFVTGDGESTMSAIFYMLRGGSFSHLHRLRGDELYHFYMGDPVELTELLPDGGVRTTVLGGDIAGGEVVQHLVPGGNWQGSCLKEGGEWALLGTTMSPAYTVEEYEHGDAGELLKLYPSAAEEIARLTGDLKY